MIIALIPAHNEAEGITQSVTALLEQDRCPDRVIVIADNCTDATESLARAAGAEVFVTVGNTAKKAGALNQVLHSLIPTLNAEDFVFVQDADSVLDQGFLRAAETYMYRDPYLGAVGGTFRGQDGGGFVGHLQRNEYARYARDVRRLNGKCLVVTGTAALLRASALFKIVHGRLEGALPSGDGNGGVYDTTVLTEDNELTFALMHQGYKVLSPEECTLTTEVMPTWKALWQQRLRWKRGAVENCVQYGFTRITGPYWGRQVFTMLGVMVTMIYLGTIVWSFAAYGGLHIAPFWIAVTGIFMIERFVTLQGRGFWRRVVALTMYELPFDIFMQFCHGTAYINSIIKTERKW